MGRATSTRGRPLGPKKSAALHTPQSHPKRTNCHQPGSAVDFAPQKPPLFDPIVWWSISKSQASIVGADEGVERGGQEGDKQRSLYAAHGHHLGRVPARALCLTGPPLCLRCLRRRRGTPGATPPQPIGGDATVHLGAVGPPTTRASAGAAAERRALGIHRAVACLGAHARRARRLCGVAAPAWMSLIFADASTPLPHPYTSSSQPHGDRGQGLPHIHIRQLRGNCPTQQQQQQRRPTMATRAVLQAFERFQRERVAFVSSVAEMAKNPQVIT